MNWVDLAVIGVLLLSGLIGFLRGLVREILGLAAWIIAGLLALRSYHLVAPKLEPLLGAQFAEPAAFVLVFIIALIVLSILAGWIGRLSRTSALGGADRTLGLVFGLARGAVLLFGIYAVAGMLVPPDRWPPVVVQARLVPYLYRGANWAADFLPAEYRPRIAAPPEHAAVKPEDLFQANPAGRATGTAPGSGRT